MYLCSEGLTRVLAGCGAVSQSSCQSCIIRTCRPLVASVPATPAYGAARRHLFTTTWWQLPHRRSPTLAEPVGWWCRHELGNMICLPLFFLSLNFSFNFIYKCMCKVWDGLCTETQNLNFVQPTLTGETTFDWEETSLTRLKIIHCNSIVVNKNLRTS